VNQFIEQHPKKLPPEFTVLGYKPEPWQPIHTVNLIGYMAWDLAGSWNNEITLFKLSQKLDEEKLQQLIPDLDQHRTYVHPEWKVEKLSDVFHLLESNSNIKELGLEVFSASNSWAVTGSKSKTGNALFANDMHLGFGAPGIWYQIHQVIEGKLNVTGVALPGAPVVVVGHNDRIAWGMTNLYVDEMDFYIETLNENATAYLFNDQWIDLDIRQEKIIVGKSDTIIRENKFTHRGPIISDFKKIADHAISMRWTGNEYSNELRSIYLLNHAANWDEFRDALSTLLSVSQNVTYADVDGNIGMQSCAAVPLRNDGYPVFIYPGNTSRYDWVGMLPFDELPYTYNPPEEYVSSANNRTIGDDYPYYIGHWFDLPFRIDRIREMIEEKDQYRPDDFKMMQADFKSKLVERYIGDLLEILSNETGFTANEQAAFDFLAEWDMVLSSESCAATVFEHFYNTFIKNILIDEIGEEQYQGFGSGLARNMFDHVWRNRTSSWVNNIHTPENETFEEMVVMSFKETVLWIEENLGTNPEGWNWGKIHQLAIKHPMGSVKMLDRILKLNKGPFPVGGSFHTVNPKAYSSRDPYSVVHGASQRHIFNMNDLTESFVIIPTGVSGIPASKYYIDQVEMFLNNEYRKNLWIRDDVISQAKYHAVFKPE
jgi:penicillin G amidase